MPFNGCLVCESEREKMEKRARDRDSDFGAEFPRFPSGFIIPGSKEDERRLEGRGEKLR